MNIAPAVLADQVARARALWPFLTDLETSYGLPPFLLFAAGSRETNLDPAYAQGSTGDGGHGHGVWQLDDRWHVIPEGFDTDPRAQALTAAEQLASLRAAWGGWLEALNAYNSGSPLTAKTTGGDYGPDVLARQQWLEAHFLPPVDDTPPGPPEKTRGPIPQNAPMDAAEVAMWRRIDGLG